VQLEPSTVKPVFKRNRPFSVYHFPRGALTLCPQLFMGISPRRFTETGLLFHCLQLKCDELLSSFDFSFNLSRSNKATQDSGAETNVLIFDLGEALQVDHRLTALGFSA
jgi:hypothetical protein